MLATVGLSHKTAPLEVREQVAVLDSQIPEILAALAADPDIAQGLVLSTCNRTEVYLTTRDRPPVDRIAAVLAARRGVPVGGLLPHMTLVTGEEAARHALRVAGGLESMVLGEPQILGQVRRAYNIARVSGTTGPVLNRLMQVAIACGRRVRAETGLGRRAASVPHAALADARRLLGSMAGRRLVIVGAGEMAELVAKVFAHAGARLAAVANRTVRTAEAVAARYGAAGIGLADLRSAIPQTDIVVVAVGADHPVLSVDAFTQRATRVSPLIVIDISVPRAVRLPIGPVPAVILRDLDALGPVDGPGALGDEVARASAIIEDALDAFLRWLAGRSAAPVITALHRRAERIIDEEFHRARSRLRGLDTNQRRAVRGVVEGALRKMLHAPFVRLRAQGDDTRAIALARELFDLDDAEEAAGGEER